MIPRHRRLAALALWLVFSACQREAAEKFPVPVLHLASPPIGGLDPVRHGDQPSHRLQSNIYETLYTYDYLARPYRLVPLLAEGMPEVGDNGTTVRIAIRRGVYFHPDPCCSRQELTADDLVFSLRRLLEPAAASPSAWILSGKVKEVAAEGPYLLRLTLTRPLPELPHLLAMTATAAVDRRAALYYGETFDRRAVGTGPYRVFSYEPGQRLLLVANRQYGLRSFPPGPEVTGSVWARVNPSIDPDAGRPLPLAESAEIRFFSEAQTMWLHFLRGDIDLCPLPSEMAAAALDDSGGLKAELARRGIRFWRGPLLDATYLIFNFRDPLLGRSPVLRQAIWAAIDRRRLIRLFYAGLGQEAHDLIPPALEGISDAVYPGSESYQPRRAAQWMVKVEGKRPIRLTLDLQADRQSRQFGEFLSGQLKPLGIALTVRQGTNDQFLGRLARGDFQLAPMSWAADYPDPLNFLQVLYSQNRPPGPNLGAFADPEFDRAFEQAGSQPDGSKRRELINFMRWRASEQRALIYLLHREGVVLYHSWLNHYHYGDFSNAPFAFLGVNPAVKKRFLPEVRKR